MDLEHGFGLFALGMILTVLGFGIAFYFGSKQTKPEPELTEVEKSIKDIYNVKLSDTE